MFDFYTKPSQTKLDQVGPRLIGGWSEVGPSWSEVDPKEEAAMLRSREKIKWSTSRPFWLKLV